MHKILLVKYIATTLQGSEEKLADELKEFGAENIEILNRAVSFEGDKALMYTANYLSRLALRILKPIYKFKVNDEQSLYDKVYKYNWTRIFSHKHTFAIDSIISSPYFNHSHYVSLKIKDAIVDQFRDKLGKRPSVNIQESDFRFHAYINDDECQISLDTSGFSLHKRGYRESGHKAPLNEVLAASLIQWSGWDGNTPLLDPMCGSGTILIEAAMYQGKIPCGFYRKNKYSFMNYKDYDESLFNSIKNKYDTQINLEPIKLFGGDHNPAYVNMAQFTIKQLKLEQYIKVIKSPFSRYPNEAIPKGTIIVNPPYGERLNNDDSILSFYSDIGDILKQQYSGWNAWILSSNFTALKQIALKPSKSIMVYNGPLQCKFQLFEMYQGSKKN